MSCRGSSNLSHVLLVSLQIFVAVWLDLQRWNTLLVVWGWFRILVLRLRLEYLLCKLLVIQIILLVRLLTNLAFRGLWLLISMSDAIFPPFHWIVDGAVVLILLLPISLSKSIKKCWFKLGFSIRSDNCWCPILDSTSWNLCVEEGSDYCVCELSGIGVASGHVAGHLVVLSIIVRQYRNPFEGGREPTISKYIYENLSSGTGICSGIRLLCLCIFALWQARHVFVQ